MIISPYALQIILSLIYHSSYGTSESEIQTHAHFIEPQYTHNINTVIFSDFVTNLYVKLGNRIYLKSELKLNKTFDIAFSDFQGMSEEVNFNEPKLVAQNINSWVKDQMDEETEPFISSDKIPSDSKIWFLNTICLNINWKNNYTNESISTNKFKSSGNSKYQTQFIKDKNIYQAVIDDANLKVDAVEIDLIEDSFMSLLLIMPKESSSIEEISNILTIDYYIEIISKLTAQEVDLMFPIFNMDTIVDAKNEFIKFGIKTMKSNLQSKILDNDDVTNFTKMLHRTKIEFNLREDEAERLGKIYI